LIFNRKWSFLIIKCKKRERIVFLIKYNFLINKLNYIKNVIFLHVSHASRSLPFVNNNNIGFFIGLMIVLIFNRDKSLKTYIHIYLYIILIHLIIHLNKK